MLHIWYGSEYGSVSYKIYEIILNLLHVTLYLFNYNITLHLAINIP